MKRNPGDGRDIHVFLFSSFLPYDFLRALSHTWTALSDKLGKDGMVRYIKGRGPVAML